MSAVDDDCAGVSLIVVVFRRRSSPSSAGEGSWDGANRACANAVGEAPPDCVDVVYDEIRRLRGGAWRTRLPAGVRPTDARCVTRPRHTGFEPCRRPPFPLLGARALDRFWRAVEHLENELQARGLLVYDGHTANSAFKVRMRWS